MTQWDDIIMLSRINTQVNSSNLSQIGKGDEVIIFGEGQSAEELAEKINTISYELLTAVSQRVKRVFLR